MADLDVMTRDYSIEPVPGSEAVSGLRIALIVIGFTITLPVLLTGSEIGIVLGLTGAVEAFVIGGLILAFVGCMTAYIGARSRLSTYMITQFSFGAAGARVINLLLAVALFGWYGVTAQLFGQAVQNAVIEISGLDWGVLPYTIVGSLLMVLTTVWGFKALDKLALFAVPLMMLFLGVLAWFSVGLKSWDEIVATTGSGMDAGVAVSLVVGSYIVGCILLPDLCRYARRASDGVFAAFVSLGVAFPAVFFVAALPSLATGELDLVVVMMALGLGFPALAMIVFATWTTNANNLYSTSLTLATLFTRHAKWKITIAAGLLGTLIAALDVMHYFVEFLLFLGICIPPIAGIYIADFFFIKRRCYDLEMLAWYENVNTIAFAAWLVASLAGYAAANGILRGSSIPACDSIIIAFASYLALMKLRAKRRRLRAGEGRMKGSSREMGRCATFPVKHPVLK